VPSRAIFLCISVNPAIDKRIRAANFRAGAVNRATEVVGEPGGKSAHVALSLVTLGESPRWLGLAGGSGGEELVRGLNEAGIQAHGVKTEAPSRVNLAISDERGVVTELLEPGGPISVGEVDAFQAACEKLFAEMGDRGFVIFSGSLPAGVPEDFYAKLIRSARAVGCRTMLDTSERALQMGLGERPDFVKPNQEEAESLLGRSISSAADAQQAANDICDLGAGTVALSLGKNGLLWCPGRGRSMVRVLPLAIEGRSCVGSGDASVAGFAVALAREMPAEDAASLAVACGAANCLADSPGRIRMADVEKARAQLRIEVMR
jgi:1-phosphofructokinase family hexose kinase